MTDRYRWKQILPIIQAFVDGKDIQQLGYDKRWKDTDQMMNVMSGCKFRIKPEQSLKGTWTINYSFRTTGDVDGPVGIGQMSWKGSNDETPPWPKSGKEYQYDHDSQEFTPDIKIDVNEEEILED